MERETLAEEVIMVWTRGCASKNRQICTHKNWNINPQE